MSVTNILLKTNMSSENNRSKDSTAVNHIFDAANENFTRLVSESSRVQPQYAQAVSNLQLECIDGVRNSIQTTLSVQKQLANSYSNFNNVIIPETSAPYGLVKQSTDFTTNIIRITDFNNQLTINALNVLREAVKNYSRTVEAAAEYNSNLTKAWASSYSSFQQQFTTNRQ